MPGNKWANTALSINKWKIKYNLYRGGKRCMGFPMR